MCNLLICRYVMESNDSSLHHVSNLMIFDLYVLGLVMKYEFLLQSDPTLVKIYHCIVQNLPKHLSKELPQPNCFTTSYASGNILCLSSTQSYKLLFPAHPRYHGRTKAKTTSISAFFVTTFLAQSTSVYPWSWTSLAEYLRPRVIIPCRYLKMCLATIQCAWRGLVMNLLNVFTT